MNCNQIVTNCKEKPRKHLIFLSFYVNINLDVYKTNGGEFINKSMKEKIEKESKSNIVYLLKRIFIDSDEVATEIPGLDKIVPKTMEDEKILEDLKRDEEARNKRNAFKREMEAKYSSKIKNAEPKNQENATKNKENKINNKDKDDGEMQL